MSENQVNYFQQRKVIEPGGFYFGDEEHEIYTLLGSCVAVTLWHPMRKLAGMCHIVLPKQGQDKPSTRFADCAISEFLRLIRIYKTKPYEYDVGVYGGGNMFPLINKANGKLIGSRNIVEIERLLQTGGFDINYKDAGGKVARKLSLNRIDGSIVLEHVKIEEV